MRYVIMRLLFGAVGFGIVLALFVLFWSWGAASFPPHMVPSLQATLARLGRGDIWPEAIAGGVTLLATFLRALVYSLPIAIFVGLTPIGFATFFPVLRTFAMLPVVALLPLAFLWFGISMSQEGVHGPALLAMMAVIAAGVTAVVHKAHDGPARVASFAFPTGAEIRDAFRRELRGMFGTFRRAIEIGAVTLIAHHYVAGRSGIGYLLLNGAMMLDAAQTQAAVLAAWAMVIVLELLLFAVEFGLAALVVSSS